MCKNPGICQLEADTKGDWPSTSESGYKSEHLTDQAESGNEQDCRDLIPNPASRFLGEAMVSLTLIGKHEMQ